MKTPELETTVTLAMLLCMATPGARAAAPAAAAAEVRAIRLPGTSAAAGVGMDLIAYDRSHHRVWVPAGNTGNVDVVDTGDGHVTAIEGFATAEVERNGKRRTVGPSSATVGEGYVYVGNRGDSSVCAIAADSLEKGPCIRLEAMPDAVVYVPATKEVWVTTPRRDAIVVIDVPKGGPFTVKAEVHLDGAPEGFAVDDKRGLFYTNLEDKDRTLALDVRSRKVTANWPSSCGEDGPKGLALDRARDFLLVACADRVKVLDVGHDGKELSAIDTGAGVDDIAYLEARHEVYVGAAKAAKLTVATLDPKGKLAVEASVETAPGARNAVVTDEGIAYLTDSPEGKLLVVSPSRMLRR